MGLMEVLSVYINCNSSNFLCIALLVFVGFVSDVTVGLLLFLFYALFCNSDLKL